MCVRLLCECEMTSFHNFTSAPESPIADYFRNQSDWGFTLPLFRLEKAELEDAAFAYHDDVLIVAVE